MKYSFGKIARPEAKYLCGIRGCYFAERTFGIKAKRRQRVVPDYAILPKELLESRQSHVRVLMFFSLILPKELLESRQSSPHGRHERDLILPKELLESRQSNHGAALRERTILPKELLESRQSTSPCGRFWG